MNAIYLMLGYPLIAYIFGLVVGFLTKREKAVPYVVMFIFSIYLLIKFEFQPGVLFYSLIYGYISWLAAKSVKQKVKPSFEDLTGAKELYFHYCGSSFFMARDGDQDKYEKFNISKEQEIIWAKELICQLIDKLSLYSCTAVRSLSTIAGNDGDYKILEKVLEYVNENIDRGDSFIKVRYAESLVDILETIIKCKKECPKELMINTLDKAKEVLDSVLKEPYYINPNTDIKFVSDILNEQYIKERAQRRLDELFILKKRFKIL